MVSTRARQGTGTAIDAGAGTCAGPGMARRRRHGTVSLLAIWAAATLPMGLLAWVVAPWLAPRLPLAPGITYWLLMVAGMAWQTAVAVLVLRAERRRWTWPRLRARLWLRPPRSPRDGRRRWRLLAWALPAIAFVLLTSDLGGDVLDAPMRWLFPALSLPAHADIHGLVSPAFHGRWWLLALALASCLFNYVLGEALLFHGVLLPRMRRVYGRHAWLANALLFGAYHVHLLPMLPSVIVSNMAYSLPTQRYRSLWLALLVHGVEGVVLLAFVLLVVVGVLP